MYKYQECVCIVAFSVYKCQECVYIVAFAGMNTRNMCGCNLTMCQYVWHLLCTHAKIHARILCTTRETPNPKRLTPIWAVIIHGCGIFRPVLFFWVCNFPVR